MSRHGWHPTNWPLLLPRAVLVTGVVLLLAACTGVPGAASPAGSAATNRTASTGQHTLGATTLSGRFLVEPDDGVQPFVSAIDSAQHTIDLTIYLLTDREVIAALEASVKRGVRTRVLLEEHPVGNGPGNGTIYRRLQQAGVAVKWSNPAFRLTHEKSLMIDGKTAFIMSANLTYSAVTHNREYAFVDTDPQDVAADEAIFTADWNRTSVTPNDPHLVVSPINSRAKLTALINSATRTLFLEEEEMEDRQLEAALIAAAHRGVQVRVIVPAMRGPSDYNLAGVHTIEQGGVQVRGLVRPYPHAKMILADDHTLFIGSENISTPSLDAERELGILLTNADAIKRVDGVFQSDWSAAQPISS
ncbi:MAG: phospholipase D-like domain-containing protein [Chloroflexi bacterium]|nr:phospholipase D-like domain-containing protein [Chloroflexota bacterium]